MVQLDYRDARPIYTQIIDGFREQIISGILHPGDRLPSVRELASRLAINPNTIQRSYRTLEAEGWIITIPGKGCFVCSSESCQEQERSRLLQQFDEVCAALTALGISTETLAQRLTEGGNKHA